VKPGSPFISSTATPTSTAACGYFIFEVPNNPALERGVAPEAAD
jgi:hypothetical protein